MDWYNGYTPAERAAKGRARLRVAAEHPEWKGPCSICGDGESRCWAHSEDYSVEYVWTEPAVYVVCDRCHRRLHARFRSPEAWRAYQEFMRRGWFGREVSGDQIRDAARKGADRYSWPESPRSNPRTHTDPWWERLTVDPASLRSPSARPRP